MTCKILYGWAICHKYPDENGNIQIKTQPKIGRYRIYETRKKARENCFKQLQERIERVEIY